MMESIKYVDGIIDYATEDDLMNILRELKPDARILGTDYKDKKFTGYELDIPIYWHDRYHKYSTSNRRYEIYQRELYKINNLS